MLALRFPPVAFAALTKLAGAIAVNPRAVAILRTVTRESYVLVLCPEPARVAIALASALQRYDSTRKCQDSRQGEADCAADKAKQIAQRHHDDQC